MTSSFHRTLAVSLVATASLSGCMGLGGFGFGLGGQSGLYDDGYYGGGYDGYGYAPTYYGWYDNFYYPGTGFYVFDDFGQRYRWSNRQQRYWGERLRSYRGDRRADWSGYRRGRDRDGGRYRTDPTLDGRYGRERRDTDGDGIRDWVDATPRGPGGVMRPDQDGDGVRDDVRDGRGYRAGRRGRVEGGALDRGAGSSTYVGRRGTGRGPASGRAVTSNAGANGGTGAPAVSTPLRPSRRAAQAAPGRREAPGRPIHDSSGRDMAPNIQPE